MSTALVTGAGFHRLAPEVDARLTRDQPVRVLDNLDQPAQPEGTVPDHISAEADLAEGDLASSNAVKQPSPKGPHVHRRIAVGLARSWIKSLREGIGQRPRRPAASPGSRPEALVLHIGGHRTGSSTIQASLEASYHNLLERGILYPSAGRISHHPQHANLAYEVLDHPSHVPELGGTEALLDEIRAVAPRVVVLSSEAFTLFPRKRAAAEWARWLCEELGVTEVRVIGYVRPQWEYLESSYAYLVTHWGERALFQTYVERHFGRPRPILEYPTRFGHWREVFGDQLRLRPYDPERFPGRDVSQDFWQAVDRLPHRPDQSVNSRNLRPGQRMVEMLRLLSQTLTDQGLHKNDQLAPVLAKARRTIQNALPDDPPFRGLTPELLARIHGHFEESNRLFIERFGQEHARLIEPPDIAGRPPRWSIEAAPESERQLFMELVDQATPTLRRRWRAAMRRRGR